MRHIFVIGMLFFYIGLTAQCLAEETKKTPAYPSAPSVPKQPQRAQPSKPILPPTVLSSPLAGVSPTPSPHISAPGVMPQTITTTTHTSPVTAPQTHLPEFPSTPAQATMPTMPAQIKLPDISTFISIIGKVVNTGTDENQILWIEVRDRLLDRTLRIKIKNLEATPILRQTAAMNFEDIKSGDPVNAIFTRDGDENLANLIRIMTEEEVESLKGVEPESIHAPKKLQTTEEPTPTTENPK